MILARKASGFGHLLVALLQAESGALSSPLQVRPLVAGGGPHDAQATLDGLLGLVRDENPVLGALFDPGLLRCPGSSLRREAREGMLQPLLHEDAGVVFDSRFLDWCLADDAGAIARARSVHDWAPARPVLLFHGREDRTVPYRAAASAARRASGSLPR